MANHFFSEAQDITTTITAMIGSPRKFGTFRNLLGQDVFVGWVNDTFDVGVAGCRLHVSSGGCNLNFLGRNFFQNAGENGPELMDKNCHP